MFAEHSFTVHVVGALDGLRHCNRRHQRESKRHSQYLDVIRLHVSSRGRSAGKFQICPHSLETLSGWNGGKKSVNQSKVL